jgi:hypothetical protein
MLRLRINATRDMINIVCPSCRQMMGMATSITRYFCLWCSRPVPPYALLVKYQNERIKYYRTGRVYNVNTENQGCR